MSQMLNPLRNALTRKSSESVALLQQELIRLVSVEMQRDLEVELLNETNGFNRKLAETISHINGSVIVSMIHTMDKETLTAVLSASTHPEYKTWKMLLPKAGDGIDEEIVREVREVALFFPLLHQAGIQESNYRGAFYHLGVLTGTKDMTSLRKEPDDYLLALLTIFTTMPMMLSLPGTMHPGVRRIIKRDPALVHSIINYATQRNIELRRVTPALLKEVLSVPSSVLRNGVL